jgi:hypothetical protein
MPPSSVRPSQKKLTITKVFRLVGEDEAEDFEIAEENLHLL